MAPISLMRKARAKGESEHPGSYGQKAGAGIGVAAKSNSPCSYLLPSPWTHLLWSPCFVLSTWGVEGREMVLPGRGQEPPSSPVLAPPEQLPWVPAICFCQLTQGHLMWARGERGPGVSGRDLSAVQQVWETGPEEGLPSHVLDSARCPQLCLCSHRPLTHTLFLPTVLDSGLFLAAPDAVETAPG